MNEQGEPGEPDHTARVQGRQLRVVHVLLTIYREVLYAQQKKCEKVGKYMEAETAKRQLVRVKAELEK